MNNSSSHTADLPFISHLIELRNRLMRIVIFIACIALPLSIYANEIYALLAQPLMAHLPQNSTMIATNVTLVGRDGQGEEDRGGGRLNHRLGLVPD